MTSIHVLGPIRATSDGDELDLGGPTQRRLLATLVASRDEVVSVSRLIDVLWGDDPPPSGPQSIQSYVSRLRGVLGSGVIVTQSPGYMLNSEEVEVDSVRFEELASELPTDAEHRLFTIEEALSLWDGPSFEGFEGVEFESRRLAELRFELEEERARLLATAGRVSDATAALERITASEPLRESAWLTQARILAHAGRQAEAIRALDRYRDSLAAIGLEPGPDFDEAQTEVFDTSTRFTGQNALPRVETTFVGRASETDELRRALRRHRLVTLTGPGGMGKSRLAIEGLQTWDDSPIIVVRLGSLRAESEVTPTVLNALGGESRGKPVDAVVSRMARSPALLLLDNAEHVIEATAALASTLLTRTDTRILVTSREPLNISGEFVHTVDSLDPADAVALYRDRARRVAADFTASDDVLEALCDKLDHMPLAIEMAAARSKALAPEEILNRLSHRYGLLERPLRGGTGRHRSLDSLVNWSYELLDDPTRRVFERLSVVSGAFDVDLANAVAGFGVVEEESVPAIVADLVEKSLVRRTNEGNLWMLRVLRSFASRKLAESGDTPEVRSRHAAWFARLASAIGHGLSSPRETEWIETANASVDDIESALLWAIENGDAETAQTILEGLFDWFYHRQPPALIDWGDRALRIGDEHSLRSVAGAWASLAALKRGDLSRADELARVGTSVDDDAARFSWFMVGEVACYQDHLDEALDAYKRQLTRASKMGDSIGVVDAMAGETLALAYQGVFDKAVDIATDLERVAEGIGAPTYRAFALYALGEAILDSDPDRASVTLREAADLATSVNNQYIEALAKTTLGSALSRVGRPDEAIAPLRRAVELWESMGMPSYHWAAIQFLGAVLAETGQPGPAVVLLAAAETAGRKPFSAGQRHWEGLDERLMSLDGYEEWRSEGKTLDLDKATELALDVTRPRR